MSAKQKQGMAALEEFLQEKYVDLYEKIKDDSNKVLTLINNSSTTKYFYRPDKGALQYIIDSEGHALYLINKDELPQEIKDGLVGGDAGNKEYIDYARLIDVYGVTTNLKVYYCSNGLDTIQGLAKNDLDKDNPLREVFPAGSPFANLLTGETTKAVTAEEAKSITELNLKDENITELTDLYNFPSLKTLIFDNIALKSLDGIENVIYLENIEFKNYDSNKIENYEKLSTVTKLKKLYLINSNDNQIKNVFQSMKDTIYAKLEYLGVYDGKQKVSDISNLSELKPETKKNVTYLYFYNNNLTDISCFENFSNVTTLHCYTNKITSLTPACNNMNKLKELWAYNNNLSDNPEANNYALECFSNKTTLNSVWLTNNKNLKYIGFLKSSKSFSKILLAGCPNLLGSEITLIADLYNNCGYDKNIDESLKKFLTSSSLLDYSGLNLADNSDGILTMENMSIDAASKVKSIRLQNNKDLSDSCLQEILSKFPNVESININNCNNLKTLNFVSKTPKLIELLFINTAVTDLTPLNSISTFKSIECNNSTFNNNKIDLTSIQPTISRLTRDIKSGNTFYNVGCLRISNLAPQLEKCVNLTSLELSGLEYNGTIDLSKLTTENIYIGTYGAKAEKIILPPSIDKLRQCDNNMLDFSGCTKINNYIIESTASDNINSFAECCYNIGKYNIKCENINWVRPGNTNGKVTYVSKFTNEDLTGYSLGSLINMLSGCGIKRISIGFWEYWKENESSPSYEAKNFSGNWDYEINFSDLDFTTGFESLEVFSGQKMTLNTLDSFIGCPNLKHLWLDDCKINSIEGLTNCLNLERLCLKNNSIINLYGLRNLNKLKELDLENNSVFDTTTSMNGEMINNIDIILNLNKSGVLKKLNLLNNPGLINKEKLKELKWDEIKI